ncbi:Type I inositol polyphosphate 5-phosphatase [Quillaja saponaria]|uniref:Type I inositol polyphosphate 5-phosphatase n=1 Tax=Quillaja saponaria TaxID=32244 RepID=A0AAD7Q0D8_QUISA|nr:Type I inositol polyphosphate 5-phosphatase [Quillaja saponaria]
MRTEPGKISKSSWPKIVVRKWLNIQSGADEFHSDYSIREKSSKTERRKSCSDQDSYVVVQDNFSEGWLMESTKGLKPSRFVAEAPPPLPPVTDYLRMFVGTWNVGGKSPHEGLNLKDWLSSPDPADIYVLGFQEIVPLNAGNVLGAEDNGPAAKWLSLIRQALNSNNNSDHEESISPGSDQQGSQKPSRLSFSDLLSLDDEFDREESSPTSTFMWGRQCSSPPSHHEQHKQQRRGYCLAASKQMVGIFLCVWVRADFYKHISNLKVSCVGRGILGYLGNKGSISISMTLHQTTFCFVCTHLTSGEKDGDEVRRNLDVTEILKRTQFSHSFKGLGHPLPPESILEHDKVIWLGDLNYRLAAAGCGDTHELLKKNNWHALLEKDQLRREQKAGRVFKGWQEGRIYFAPTYKYLANSDHYAAQSSKSKEKRRTPAWCDRILWKGDGLKQMWYVRGESKFSDHRPVYSLFSVQIDLTSKKPTPIATKPTGISAINSSCPSKLSTNTALPLPSTCVAKVQAEELLLLTRARSCIDNVPRF